MNQQQYRAVVDAWQIANRSFEEYAVGPVRKILATSTPVFQ